MSTKLSNLRLIESYLDDLRSLLEESERIQSLGVSSQDNDYDIRKLLSKVTKFLERNDDGEDYDELVDTYQELMQQVKTIDVKDFEYKRNIIPKPLNTKKSVRFNDHVEEYSKPKETKSFKPFKDQVIDPADEAESNELFGNNNVTADIGDEDEQSDQNSIDSASNHDLFIQHQQQMLQQDDHLDMLSQSVRRQRELGLDINSELDDQTILLNDLESQLDHNTSNLSNGQKRLKYFSEKAKENGQWVTIIILVIILVLLLIILK
ncbi:Syntaxin-51 [Wickerhamomyces ciferrii]|uniref:Syntaxin-51 n=1 Tax=Wickerhamomyces ciferrii (strain ATCC 14091 / BCRC 22168 / CBS 111 / JCM 3599 / NBRC 0793 / NRRL Y-1031 F-60-10) TaxID=1206466 RepID=K0K6G9_WICCF|nr:Syntaxin-51 [Wickerhamomyces ciferrii]CCH40535.1 Syntaxin-51 [Wickerhamomyces ciferrii]